MTDALPRSVGSCPRIAPGLKIFTAVSLPTSASFTLSSNGCAASANPPPAPAQNRFSRDGRYLKFVTRCVVIALMPVWRGVGGGPAGCCAKWLSASYGASGDDDGPKSDGAGVASLADDDSRSCARDS